MRLHRSNFEIPYAEQTELERAKKKARARTWHRKHRGTLKTDISKCKRCGAKKNIELHHPDPLQKPAYIVPLCRMCHRKKHKRKGA